ncbi:hypothetical protein [Burkholderia multivorans]|nr:hypothetical protein [Burkholderia multivorans]
MKQTGRGAVGAAVIRQEDEMGKYPLAWLLGVPAGLLVLFYLFTHLF